MNVITPLLIVTIIGVGGHRQGPLHDARVSAEPTFHIRSHPPFHRSTGRHGHAELHLIPGRYDVSASFGGRLCSSRKIVTLTGGTKRVTLICHIRQMS
jgi:hypothetical protein